VPAVTRYIFSRLLQAVPTVFLASVAIFLLIRLIPGDPALLWAGPDATPQVIAAMRQKMGLDEPLPVQYMIWAGRALRGDLGASMISRYEVWRLLRMRLPATLELTVTAFILTLLIALPLGILAAVKQHSGFDATVGVYTALGLGVPNFWLGILFILLFALALGWLPPQGRVPLLDEPARAWRHLLMPAVTLAATQSAILARFVRASMVEVLYEDHVRTARAKGLRERVVVMRHALRNALIPVVTVIGIQIGRLLGGAVIVESVFAWPGVGRMMLKAIEERDYAVVQGGLLLLVMVFITINLLTDLAYAFIDPRIRPSSERSR
jgi:peptide/nickel transport system permease protein